MGETTVKSCIQFLVASSIDLYCIDHEIHVLVTCLILRRLATFEGFITVESFHVSRSIKITPFKTRRKKASETVHKS